jgi:hypothetical protein
MAFKLRKNSLRLHHNFIAKIGCVTSPFLSPMQGHVLVCHCSCKTQSLHLIQRAFSVLQSCARSTQAMLHTMFLGMQRP